MPAKEALGISLTSPNNKGIIINPMSDNWGMDREQISNFLNEV